MLYAAFIWYFICCMPPWGVLTGNERLHKSWINKYIIKVRHSSHVNQADQLLFNCWNLSWFFCHSYKLEWVLNGTSTYSTFWQAHDVNRSLVSEHSRNQSTISSCAECISSIRSTSAGDWTDVCGAYRVHIFWPLLISCLSGLLPDVDCDS